MQLLLGVDDTDVIGQKPGTGRLARDLGAYLQQRGLARLVGVVRHQLLVDPRIPYTSHNSPACLIVTAAASAAQEIFDVAGGYIVTRCAPGSDPGLCVAEQEKVGAEVVRFGQRASSEVVSKLEATTVASGRQLILQELGGTGDGIIGALAAVGLTAGPYWVAPSQTLYLADQQNNQIGVWRDGNGLEEQAPMPRAPPANGGALSQVIQLTDGTLLLFVGDHGPNGKTNFLWILPVG